MSWATMKPGADVEAIPAKAPLNMRPMVIAGLAKLDELMKKQAAPIYAPTAAGVTRARPGRARTKITKMSPVVAMILTRKCAGVSR